MKFCTGSKTGFAVRSEDALPEPRKFNILYYDVLKETVSTRDHGAAVRWMGWKYGGIAGMRVEEVQ